MLSVKVTKENLPKGFGTVYFLEQTNENNLAGSSKLATCLNVLAHLLPTGQLIVLLDIIFIKSEYTRWNPNAMDTYWASQIP